MIRNYEEKDKLGCNLLNEMLENKAEERIGIEGVPQIQTQLKKWKSKVEYYDNEYRQNKEKFHKEEEPQTIRDVILSSKPDNPESVTLNIKT